MPLLGHRAPLYVEIFRIFNASRVGWFWMALFLFLAASAVVLYLIGRTPDDKTPPSRPAPAREQQPQPFDTHSAQPTPAPIVLSGPAFVVDGDTLVIRKTQIRLFGVDAPEMNHPYGVRAKRGMMRLCKGQTIRAEVTEQDAYGRTVAKCYLPDGRDLSAEIVKLGLAIDWAKFSGGKYRNLEVADARRKMWLADARQKGRMHVWEKFEAQQAARKKQAQG
ncbi:thermonuclease family protein [Actibacterium sp. XHP0104]|uniref:thermonuclease family protein n=1 Tax=Actibacterium sp. XHP0104 TaxID=2984335 RepID=UPI0021E797EE|nr:thermonuclease family protein [Actibacterium sp. XHP0104]MCV2882802.1 thermonuclease family protein [Actibacterium sp. XHP0104]